MMTLRRPALITLAALGALALAGCGGPETPPPPETNLEEAGPVVNEPEVINEAPLPTPTPTTTNLTAEDPAEAKAVEQQMQEDADATGMTARIDRSAEQPAEDKAQPADVTEKK
jgi:hypothetical protein